MSDYQDVDSFLEHHGVKGMKWGVHRDRPSSSDIHTARANQMARRADYNKAKRSGSETEKAKAADAFNNNADRAVAAHLTSGEKAATAALSLIGASGVGTIRANSAANLTGKSIIGHALLDNNIGPIAIARAGHQAKKLS